MRLASRLGITRLLHSLRQAGQNQLEEVGNFLAALEKAERDNRREDDLSDELPQQHKLASRGPTRPGSTHSTPSGPRAALGSSSDAVFDVGLNGGVGAGTSDDSSTGATMYPTHNPPLLRLIQTEPISPFPCQSISTPAALQESCSVSSFESAYGLEMLADTHGSRIESPWSIPDTQATALHARSTESTSEVTIPEREEYKEHPDDYF